MSGWAHNRDAEASIGMPTFELVAARRKAMVNVTPVGDGTSIVSLSLVVSLTVEDARTYAAHLLDQHETVAVPSEP